MHTPISSSRSNLWSKTKSNKKHLKTVLWVGSRDSVKKGRYNSTYYVGKIWNFFQNRAQFLRRLQVLTQGWLRRSHTLALKKVLTKWMSKIIFLNNINSLFSEKLVWVMKFLYVTPYLSPLSNFSTINVAVQGKRTHYIDMELWVLTYIRQNLWKNKTSYSSLAWKLTKIWPFQVWIKNT